MLPHGALVKQEDLEELCNKISGKKAAGKAKALSC